MTGLRLSRLDTSVKNKNKRTFCIYSTLNARSLNLYLCVTARAGMQMLFYMHQHARAVAAATTLMRDNRKPARIKQRDFLC
jgi:hypothetical protein